MAIDVHRLEAGGHAGELLLRIDERELAALNGAFELFRNRTGLFIDLYGTCKFRSGLKVLISAVEDSLAEMDETHRELCKAFLSSIKKFDENRESIVFVGD